MDLERSIESFIEFESFKITDLKKLPKLAPLYLKYYNVAMGKNLTSLAATRLFDGTDHSSDSKLKAEPIIFLEIITVLMNRILKKLKCITRLA